MPAERILAETDSPYLAPQPVRGRRNEPAHVVHTLATLAAARGEDPGELAAPDRRQRPRRLRASRERSRPKKALGQHFLVDENILGVIGRLAELDAGRRRARGRPGARRAHALPRRARRPRPRRRARPLARAAARRAVGDRGNVELHWGDALALDLAALEPPPTKLVANLPYNVATPIVAESLAGLPSVELWCVMVQREVADRFFAVPSTKAYGAVSVLVQLATPPHRLPPGLPHGLPAAAERRLRARRLPSASQLPDGFAAVQGRRRGCVRPSAQDAAELARARRARRPRARRPPRSRRSAVRRVTRAEALAPDGVRRARRRRCA